MTCNLGLVTGGDKLRRRGKRVCHTNTLPTYLVVNLSFSLFLPFWPLDFVFRIIAVGYVAEYRKPDIAASINMHFHVSEHKYM